MLQKIHIENVALIDELEIDFDSNFNVLSGETGAGKSIIIDSLFLLLGGKYDKTLLKHGTSSGVVEGVFDTNDHCRRVLLEFGFDESDVVVIRRKFLQNGRNEIKINGQNATPNMLKDVTNTLVDICGQNQHIALINKSEQLAFLDQFLPDTEKAIFEKVSTQYIEYRGILHQIRDMGDSAQRLRELEMLKYQISEIEKAKVQPDEEQSLVDKRKLLLSFEKSKDSLSRVVHTIERGEHSILSQIASIRPQLHMLDSLPDFASLSSRVDDIKVELVDIGALLQDKLLEMDFDQKDLDNLEKRLATIRNIQRKYGDYDKCQKFLSDIKTRFDMLNDADNLSFKLEAQLQKASETLYKSCVQLSNIRRKAANTLADRLVEEVQELGMEGSRFEIKFTDMPDIVEAKTRYTSNGFDEVEFYLSTNIGQPIKPLSKVASGGEMSRFMLCIKTIASDVEHLDTLIFDEIDTGISGVIGQAVARKLAKISRQKQVICISHLPQIASMADSNYLITKSTVDNDTTTSVVSIKGEQLLKEIARLTGGIGISSQSVATAKEMVQWCDAYKKGLMSKDPANKKKLVEYKLD